MWTRSICVSVLTVSLVRHVEAFTTLDAKGCRGQQSTRLWNSLTVAQDDNLSDKPETKSRRDLFKISVATLTASSLILPLLQPEPAIAATGAQDGNLPDLPPDGVRSYLQYRTDLQISADYYLWELQDMVSNTDKWGDVEQIFRVNNNRGQGQPSRVERQFVNPMRILGLSMPPDIADSLRESQFKFEKAMSIVTKATAGIRRDLPVEIAPQSVASAKEGWELGRVALNEFFVTINGATGLSELKAIPPSGPNQTNEYGRSPRRYFELMKKTKLCQNRGGPTLSQAWGQLMVSGYMQDSCGIPDLEAYFYQ